MNSSSNKNDQGTYVSGEQVLNKVFDISSVEETPKQVSFIDLDTVETPTGKQIRIGGVNAPEINHSGIGPAPVGSQELTESGVALAKSKGFDKPVVYGGQDRYDRSIGDLANEKGELFSDYLLRNGFATPTVGASKDQVAVWGAGRLERVMRKAEGFKPTKEDQVLKDYQDEITAFGGLVVKPLAITEREYAQNPDLYQGVMIRRSDRTLDNKAKSITGTAFAMAATGISEGYYGAIELVGDLLDPNNASNHGDANVKRLQKEMALLPVLENQRLFDDNGDMRLESLGDAAEFLYTNLIISAPYMAQTMAGVLAGAAIGGPVGALVGIAAPFATYTGQIYAAQEEKDKNPALAVGAGLGMALLERLGASSVLGSSQAFNVNFFSKEGREKIVNTFINDQKELGVTVTPAQAQQHIAKNAREVLSDFNQSVKTSLAGDIALKNAGIQGIASFGRGFAGEGLTESLQELVQYVGENRDFDDYDSDEIFERMATGLIAGGALGGGFSTIGSVYDYVKTSDILTGEQVADTPSSLAVELQDEEKARTGKVRTTEEAQAELEETINSSGIVQDEGINDFNTRNQGASRTEKIKNYIKDFGVIGGLFSSPMRILGERYAKRKGRKADGTTTTILRDLFSSIGGGIKGLSGAYDEQHQQLLTARYDNHISSNEKIVENFNAKNTEEVSDIMYSSEVQSLGRTLFLEYNQLKQAGVSFVEQAKKIIARNNIVLPEGKQDAVISLLEEVYNLEQAKGVDIGSLLNRKILSKSKIESNPDKMRDLLVEDGFSPKEAAKLIDAYISNINATSLEDINDPEVNLFSDEDFSGTLKQFGSGIITPDNPRYAEFFVNNILDNIRLDNQRSAAIITNDKFYGKNGAKVVAAIKAAVASGEIKTEEEAQQIATAFNYYFKVRSGTLDEFKSRRAKKANENLILLTTTNSLPLATLSSLVETALLTKLLTKDLIFKGLSKAGYELGIELGNYTNEIASKTGLVQRKDYFEWDESNRSMLRKTGFGNETQSAMARTGVDAGSVNRNKILNSFFKLIGLQGYTNFIRTLRLGLSGDAIEGFLNILEPIENVNKPETVNQQDARKNLIDLGINIDKMLRLRKEISEIDSEQELKNLQDDYAQELLVGAINFVDMAVANPRAGNRPFFYSNRRFAMFTSFQGFISTFTSEILPGVYKGLLSRRLGGKIDAARQIALLIALGFATQALRDMIKYDDDPEWMDDEFKLQRALYASGLLGSTERIFDLAFPLYPQRSDGLIGSAVNLVEGEAPALGYLSRVGDAIGAAYGGDYGEAAGKVSRLFPGTGPLYTQGKNIETTVNNAIDNAFGGE